MTLVEYLVRKIRYYRKLGNKPVADPGFPMGGCGPIGGVWSPDMGAFWQKCMQK